MDEEYLFLACWSRLDQRQPAASLELVHDGRNAFEPFGAFGVIGARLVLERG